MSAIEFLERAADLMLERGEAYDRGSERSIPRVVYAFNAITGSEMTNHEGWLFMCLLKMVRQHQQDEWHRDSSEDLIAYTALMAESWQEAGEVEIEFDADFEGD